MQLSDKQKKNLGIIAIAACLLLLFLDFLIINFIQDVFRYDLTGKNKFVWVILIILDVIVLSVLLKRTYDRYNLNNIIEELQNIAKYKQFDSRIEVNNLYDVKLSTLVNAINDLITATNKSIDDQKKAEKTKDELITNVGHDIRTPLTSIIGYLGLIENKSISKDDLHKYAHIAYLKSKQMKTLVEELFEYLKVSGTKDKLNVSKMNVSQMLQQLAISYELDIERKGLKIFYKTNPENIYIEADPDKLGRVFNNLISNALKYGENATFISLFAKLDGKQIVIYVSNDGKKIPRNSLDQLFERFYRVENSRSKETGGTGLGLAIAKDIVTAHHGNIYAESNDNITSFVVKLPVNQDEF